MVQSDVLVLFKRRCYAMYCWNVFMLWRVLSEDIRLVQYLVRRWPPSKRHHFLVGSVLEDSLIWQSVRGQDGQRMP